MYAREGEVNDYRYKDPKRMSPLFRYGVQPSSNDSYRLLPDNDEDNWNKDYDTNDRIGLIRKVYGILATQLLITASLTVLPYLNEGIRHSLLANPGIVLLASISALILSCCIFCVKSLSRTVPTNYILMFIFTACEAYTVAYICASVGDPLIVIQAAFLTASLVLGLTLYAMKTKTDFTAWGGLLWGLGAVLLVFSLFSALFGTTMRIIYCTLGVALFSVYLIFDT